MRPREFIRDKMETACRSLAATSTKRPHQTPLPAPPRDFIRDKMETAAAAGEEFVLTENMVHDFKARTLARGNGGEGSDV